MIQAAIKKHFLIFTLILRLSVCRRYDEISERSQEMPDNTADLVKLQKYVKDASEVRVVKLQSEIDEAGERLLFLLDYATLPCKFPDYQFASFSFQLIWFLTSSSDYLHICQVLTD